MFETWTKQKLVDRIIKDNESVEFYLQWANSYITVSPADALNFLRHSEMKVFPIQIIYDKVFIGIVA